uniref:Uncharacterized protein n=1 Tax=Zea mays TaxID=4577 RepID=B6TFM9_MAIZE|nr:hypothetical protein [Zea mays]
MSAGHMVCGVALALGTVLLGSSCITVVTASPEGN